MPHHFENVLYKGLICNVSEDKRSVLEDNAHLSYFFWVVR